MADFHPLASNGGPSTSFQRYTRTAYDGNGRYPVASYEPFWNGSGAVEVQTQMITARDALGDVLQAVDAKGVQTLAVPGAMGRAYYTWAQTVAGATVGDPTGGAESWTTYRWCAGAAHPTDAVSCPQGAVFRQQVQAEGTPTKWTYYDVLGRPLLVVGATFNAGVTGQAFSGVCTYSNAVGLAERTSIPFFLDDAGVGGQPSFAVQNDPCRSRAWAITTYDILARPLRTDFADGSRVAIAYDGLTTTTTDPLNHATVTVKDALGELVSVTDSAKLTARYRYDAAGDLIQVSRDGGNGAIVTTYTYDALGRKLAQSDGDTGTYRYAYDALGELVQQTDGKGQVVQSAYDGRGRVWRKQAFTALGVLESQSQFDFDTDPAAPGPQALGSLVAQGISNATPGSTDTMSRRYSYDALGRLVGTSRLIDGATYTEATVYDALGRAQASRDATGRWLRTEYAGSGYVRGYCEGDGSDNPSCTGASRYQLIRATDAWGHVISETRGRVSTTRSYDPLDGRLLAICSTGPGSTPCGVPGCAWSTGPSDACPLQDEDYQWDAKGNLLSRSRGTTYTEQFQYDANDRLTRGWYSVLGARSFPGVPTQATDANVTEWLRYDALGNICQRLGDDGVLRNYTYAALAGCGTGGVPGGADASDAGSGYRLRQAGSKVYTTDADGSLTQEATTTGTPTRGWDYDANNRAVSAWKGPSEAAATLRTRWDYDAGGARFRRVDDGSGQAACTTLYLGAVERKSCGATVTWRRTLAGVAVMELAGSTAGIVNHTRSLLHDHLGSVVAAVDLHSGGLVERGDYGAFGGMRTAIDAVAVGVAALATTTRGFTGQEQLGSLDVIHMNGRIYDPQLGRFLQADPLVAQPANPQNWNPYAYVFNNPLANTDPTGMFSVGQALRTIAAIVVSIYFPEFAAWAWGWSAFAGAVGAGFLSGAIGTGSLKGGIEGAFTAGVTYGVGLGTAKAAWYTKAAAQGAAGGCLSVLEGGKFGNGFVSAGLTTAVMPLAGHSQYAAVRSVEGALIGGTISDLTGGKFANGAISGAVQGAMEEPETTIIGNRAGPDADNADLTKREINDFKANVQEAIGVDVARMNAMGLGYECVGDDADAYRFFQAAYSLEHATQDWSHINDNGPQGQYYSMSRFHNDASIDSATPHLVLTIYKQAYYAFRSDGYPSGGDYSIDFGYGKNGLEGVLAHEAGHAVFDRNWDSLDHSLPHAVLEAKADDWARMVWPGRYK
ncbi:MAG: RHS repeat protein [Proteobacteria bacterium]|nr:RHS repeat protein [Pseudomonadota bacterium]